jgi:hypothetical protein
MKRLLLFLIISISTFFLGLFSARESYHPVSLEEITQNIDYYEGKSVEIVTYASLFDIEEKNLTIGEPYEKKEALTFLDLPPNSIDADGLRNRLAENFSFNRHKRVKVIVTGQVSNNCNKGITCCFGKSLAIITKDIKPIGQIEDYTVPTQFQSDDSKSNSE